MSSILNSSLSIIKKALTRLNNLSVDRLSKAENKSLDTYFAILKKIEKSDRAEANTLPHLNLNPSSEEKPSLEDEFYVSGHRFLAKDDKIELTKKGLKHYEGIETATKNNYPDLFFATQEISQTLNEPMPAILIFDRSDMPEGANPTALSSKDFRTLSFSREVVDLLDKDELKYLVGHEYSHLYDSMAKNSALSRAAVKVFNRVEVNISRNGLNHKTLLESAASIYELSNLIESANLLQTVRAVRESSLHSQSKEFVADAFGAYFSGDQAAISASNKLTSRHQTTEEEPNKRQSFVRQFTKNSAQKQWQKFKLNHDSHPSEPNRIKAIKKRSFRESVEERINELKNHSDIER